MSNANPFESPQSTERKPAGKEKPETPGWAWGFFAACLGIMVLTRGGAIWGALGGGLGGVCLKVAQTKSLPVSTRVGICTVITAVLWVGIVALVNSAAR